MQRLMAFGDSFTVGQGLNPEIESPADPDPRSWPYQLADLTGIPCINQALCGASNKQIWHMLMNTKLQPDDIVIMAWSCVDRHLLIKNYPAENYPSEHPRTDHNNRITSDVKPMGIWMEDDIKVDMYYGDLYQHADAILATYTYMQLCEYHVLNQGAKILHTAIPYTPEFEYLVGEITGQWYEYNRVIDSDLDLFVPWWSTINMPFTMTETIRTYGQCHDGHMSMRSTTRFAEKVHRYLSKNNFYT